MLHWLIPELNNFPRTPDGEREARACFNPVNQTFIVRMYGALIILSGIGVSLGWVIQDRMGDSLKTIISWSSLIVGFNSLWAYFRSLRPIMRHRLQKMGLCPACGYNLKGIASKECPECGAVSDPQSFGETNTHIIDNERVVTKGCTAAAFAVIAILSFVVSLRAFGFPNTLLPSILGWGIFQGLFSMFVAVAFFLFGFAIPLLGYRSDQADRLSRIAIGAGVYLGTLGVGVLAVAVVLNNAF